MRSYGPQCRRDSGKQAVVRVERNERELSHRPPHGTGVRPPAGGSTKRAPRFGVVDRDGAVVTFDGGFHHRETEAHSAGVTGAAFVEACEPLEHSVAVVECDAGTVVGDGELDGLSPVLVTDLVTDTHTRESAWRQALSIRLRTTERGHRAAEDPPAGHERRVDRQRPLPCALSRTRCRRGRPRRVRVPSSFSSSRARSTRSATACSSRSSSASTR